MGRNRSVGTLQAVTEIYGRGGVAGFWSGLTPKARALSPARVQTALQGHLCGGGAPWPKPWGQARPARRPPAAARRHGGCAGRLCVLRRPGAHNCRVYPHPILRWVLGGGGRSLSANAAAAALQMVESGSKGAILMVAKEHINSSLLAAGTSPSAL